MTVKRSPLAVRSAWLIALGAAMISVCRDHSPNVNRSRGQMALRWCAAGMAEAGKQFRRVNGRPTIPATLNRATETVGAQRHTDTVNAA